MITDFKDKVAVLTGGASGFGLEMARIGVARGMRVVLVDVQQDALDAAVKELTEKDGWLIQWQPIKAGRRVAGVRFSFMRNPQGRLDV